MTVTYLPKGAEHTDNETVLEKVCHINQKKKGVEIELLYDLPEGSRFIFIENGIEFHVMPEVVK
jgi:hypothetical protein